MNAPAQGLLSTFDSAWLAYEALLYLAPLPIDTDASRNELEDAVQVLLMSWVWVPRRVKTTVSEFYPTGNVSGRFKLQQRAVSPSAMT